jgi:predicted metal-binding protein
MGSLISCTGLELVTVGESQASHSPRPTTAASVDVVHLAGCVVATTAASVDVVHLAGCVVATTNACCFCQVKT